MNTLNIPPAEYFEGLVSNLQTTLKNLGDSVKRLSEEIRECNSKLQPFRDLFIDYSNITPGDYIEVICAINGIDISTFRSKTKKREVSDVRNIAAHFIFRDFKGKYPVKVLSRMINRHRTIMYHSSELVSNLCQTNTDFLLKYQASETAIIQLIHKKTTIQNG